MNQGLFDCNFLQVSINSNKLMQLLEGLMKQINQHHSEIKIFRQALPTIKKSVAASLQVTEERMKIESERNALKAKQEIKHIKAHYQVMDQQLTKFTIHWQKKFKDKDNEIGRLQEQRKRMQSLINIYEENRLTTQTGINQKISNIKQQLQKLEKEIKQADSKTDDKMEMMFVKMQSIIKKNNMNTRIGDGSESKQPRKSIGPKGFKSTINSTNLSNWAAFSTKLSQIQKKYDEKQESLPQVNRVMFSKKVPQDLLKVQQSLDNSGVTSADASKQHTQNFNTLFSLCNKQNQKSMQNFKNKLVVQQQKLSLYCRKMQKLAQAQAEFKMLFKKVEERKNQEQNFELIKTQMKKIQYQLGEDMEKKLNKQVFEKEKNKILEKIFIIQENLVEKADKGDMKKAFLFMEEKIKQLIILIASDQNQQKDGAIRKTTAKCLSCDKGLQIENSSTSTPLTTRQNQKTLRNVTRKIRTRVHTNQNASLNL